MTLHTESDGVYKLAERRQARVTVALYWDSVTGATGVVVCEDGGRRVQLDVEPRSAFEAYRRPCAYAAAQGTPLPADVAGQIAA